MNSVTRSCAQFSSAKDPCPLILAPGQYCRAERRESRCRSLVVISIPLSISRKKETAGEWAGGDNRPGTPCRQRHAAEGENHDRQPGASGQGRRGPGTGTEATKTHARRGRRDQASRTRAGGENRQHGAGRPGHDRRHHIDRAPRERTAGQRARRNPEHANSRTARAHRGIGTQRAPSNQRKTRTGRGQRHAGHQRSGARRQRARTGEPRQRRVAASGGAPSGSRQRRRARTKKGQAHRNRAGGHRNP